MAIQMSPDSVYLSPAPLYHTAPCLWTMSAQAMGVTIVVMSKFDPEAALDAIQTLRCHRRPVRPGDVRPDAETA